MATASLGNCEANDGDDGDDDDVDDGRITQSAWNFYSRSGGIHNKSALEVAALAAAAAVVARFPLGSRPTNGARTAVAAGQAEAQARTGGRHRGDCRDTTGSKCGNWRHTMDTHNDNNNSTRAVQHSVWCNNNKGGCGTGSGSGARACARNSLSLPSHWGNRGSNGVKVAAMLQGNTCCHCVCVCYFTECVCASP